MVSSYRASKVRRTRFLLSPWPQLTSTGPSRSTGWRKSMYSPSPENIPNASHLLPGPPTCRSRKLLSPLGVISAPPTSPSILPVLESSVPDTRIITIPLLLEGHGLLGGHELTDVTIPPPPSCPSWPLPPTFCILSSLILSKHFLRCGCTASGLRDWPRISRRSSLDKK